MTTNQKYGGINRRFDKRASLLRRFGFKYVQLAEGVAAFTRTKYGRVQNVPAATLMLADAWVWRDELQRLLYR